MEEIAHNLDPSIKTQLHEVADQLLEVYRTLARMRYLKHDSIQPGPHDISESLPRCRAHGIAESIIYLYSILPYIDPKDAGRVDFFHGGYFADFRIARTVEYARDPFYFEGNSDEEDGLMKPWMTPLSALGNHESCIIYCANTHRIWVVDQIGWDTTDPGLKKGWHEVPQEEMDETDDGMSEGENMSDSGSEHMSADEEIESDMDYESTGEEQSDEEKEEERTEPYGRLEEIPSRPASEFLRDLNRWYLELKETPGGGSNTGLKWKNKGIKDLYRQHGWPGDDFDGDAFIHDLDEAEAARRLRYRAEEPLRHVETLRLWASMSSEEARERVKEKLATAKDVDEEWLVHLDLWDHEARHPAMVKDLEEAKEAAEWRCPGGQPETAKSVALWREHQLQQLFASKQGELERMRQAGSEAQQAMSETASDFQLQLRQTAKMTRIYSMAYDIARNNAERFRSDQEMSSRPQIDLSDNKGIVNVCAEIEYATNGVRNERRLDLSLRAWAAQVPGEAPRTKKAVEAKLQLIERNLNYFQEKLAKLMEQADSWERDNPVSRL